MYTMPLSVYSSPLRNKLALTLSLPDLAVTCNKWCLNDPTETSVQTGLPETSNFQQPFIAIFAPAYSGLHDSYSQQKSA